MPIKHHKKVPDWFHLEANSILQPLSEEFLYRSPDKPDSDCWRKCNFANGGNRKQVKHA